MLHTATSGSPPAGPAQKRAPVRMLREADTGPEPLPLANPVHVELQGIVTSINMDSLSAAYSDSVGLKVGAALSFSLELDYSAPPVTFVNGIADDQGKWQPLSQVKLNFSAIGPKFG
ncbi:MAG: hypothetical protein ABIW76_01580 [Fibrobacteria bacterium]